MSERPSSLVWSPIRAFAALFISAMTLGAAVLIAASALIIAVLISNAGGLIFQLVIASIKILGPVVMAIVILTSVLLSFGRSAQA
ncbi:hypothetical protein [Methylobacterium radiodurans]|uniref:Uncharacterized protein n=1 Tax=Methylobacterium radiodurans TaxID=2202828 RepID=A0A2U8VVG7_9HYPH|nr:hypothetical protein [Methylobacterium radiodurans]AWN37789.1 hypothetical protein DK427_20345 [Methylobacterium radiodurans]